MTPQLVVGWTRSSLLSPSPPLWGPWGHMAAVPGRIDELWVSSPHGRATAGRNVDGEKVGEWEGGAFFVCPNHLIFAVYAKMACGMSGKRSSIVGRGLSQWDGRNKVSERMEGGLSKQFSHFERGTGVCEASKKKATPLPAAHFGEGMTALFPPLPRLPDHSALPHPLLSPIR